MSVPPNVIRGATRRPDLDILDDVQSALWADGTIRTLDRDSIRVEVHEGEVVLHGHLASGTQQRLLDDLAASVPGVRSVDNRTLADQDLRVAVAQALADDPRTRAAFVRVGAYHGWIQLSGVVPSAEIRAAAEEVAASVPGVRGVETLPRLPGEPAGPVRPRLQPGIGSLVSASDGPVGRVTRVLVNPRNRLVTQFVVSPMAGASGELLVPVESIQVVNEGDMLFEGTRRDAAAHPTFDAAGFPPPPEAWRPPYPYSRDEVRWEKEWAVDSGQ